MVVGKDYSALRASPYGSLPAATLSRWRSGRTLVEVSHPSPHGQNIQLRIRWRIQGFLKVMVVGEGFEPSKSMTADLQTAPFGRSGTPPRGNAFYWPAPLWGSGAHHIK